MQALDLFAYLALGLPTGTLVLGWYLGRRQGRAELRAYRAGVDDTHRRRVAEADRTGCWVKGRLIVQGKNELDDPDSERS